MQGGQLPFHSIPVHSIRYCTDENDAIVTPRFGGMRSNLLTEDGIQIGFQKYPPEKTHVWTLLGISWQQNPV